MTEEQTPHSSSTPAAPSTNGRHQLEGVIADAIKRALDDAFQSVGVPVPATQEQALVERVSRELTVAVEKTTSYAGPFPPPEMLKSFDEVVPGLAKQIAQMALAEQQHRHRWERRALWNDIFAQSGALSLGWLLAAGCAAAAAFLAWKGNNIGAGIMLSVVAVSMVRAIIGGNRSSSQESSSDSQAKLPKMPSPQAKPSRPYRRKK